MNANFAISPRDAIFSAHKNGPPNMGAAWVADAEDPSLFQSMTRGIFNGSAQVNRLGQNCAISDLRPGDQVKVLGGKFCSIVSVERVETAEPCILVGSRLFRSKGTILVLPTQAVRLSNASFARIFGRKVAYARARDLLSVPGMKVVWPADEPMFKLTLESYENVLIEGVALPAPSHHRNSIGLSISARGIWPRMTLERSEVEDLVKALQWA